MITPTVIILCCAFGVTLALIIYLAVSRRSIRSDVDNVRLRLREQLAQHEKDAKEWAGIRATLTAENERLGKYQTIADAEAKAVELRQTAEAHLESARAQATAITA
jgi:hypothetical protein